MAHHTYSRSAMSDLGGNHRPDRKLMHENSTTTTRFSDQRHATRETAPANNHHTEGRGDGQSTTEETANEDDDEEDSSTAQDGDQDEEEPDEFAPSHGLGKGKGRGKRPAIRVEPADEELQEEDDETASNGTGLIPSKHPVNQLLMNNKKRTFSNLSSTSVLFGDDSTDQEFPRRKMARKLSNAVTKPLLTYKETDDELHENAIESDDDEDYSALNLIPDDDDDVDVMEEQEESYILQEEQQATTLLNEFRDARRFSLESCMSDNIFDVTAPLSESFMSNLPDYGFAQFFEPEPLPDSPDPAAKRKFSDSSTKRVRFDDEVQASESSSSESSELDSSVFPDLFLDQDKLPPILNQLLEIDNDDDDGDFASPQSDASFWDFGHEESRITEAEHSEDADDSDDSSGYESDMGDTTDEEDFGDDAPPRTPVQNRSVLRQPASAPGSRAATPNPFIRSSRPTGRQIPPPRGIFIHEDRTKAIAVTSRFTKGVTFYRPRPAMIPWIPLNGYHSSTSSTANNSPRNSIAQLNANASDSEVSNEVFNNALTTDIMLSGIFGSAPGTDFAFGSESVGPPEAFYPFVSVGPNGNMNIMDDDEYDDSEDYEDDLNITDFMDFGSDGDDTDLEQEDEETDVPATPATSQVALNGSTPAAPTPATVTPVTRKRTTSDAMLEHFDRGVVTAFRNNQNRYRDVASLPQDPAARASVSRPVRSGKSADSLITPLRKRSKSNRMSRTPLRTGPVNQSSPLSGVTKATSRLQHSMMSAPRAPPPRMGTFS